MITVLLLGTGLGLGLWTLLAWLFPARPSLNRRLDQLKATAEPAIVTDCGWALRPVIHLLVSLGLPGRPLRDDLVVVDRGVEQHLVRKATLALAGLALPVVVDLLLVLTGVGVAWPVPAVGTLVLAAVGFLLPDLGVRQEAERRRSTFRHALGAYLNLIRILLAGGAGVDGALTAAAGVGNGWAFQQLRQALVTARITRTTPWMTLGRLGNDLGVHQLSELAASVSLAGTEGARVRAGLAAKATALRTRELTDAEGEAQAATERMSLPVVMLFGGFLIFIGYPALAQVLNGL